MMECKVLSSLVKVFPDRAPRSAVLRKASALRGEKYSFQIAYRSPVGIQKMQFEITGKLADCASVRRVGNVVAENLGHDIAAGKDGDGYLRHTLYPDVLYTDMENLHACPHVWYSVWVDVNIPKNCKSGVYDFQIQLHGDAEPDSETDPRPAPLKFSLQVIDAVLPPQTLRHTEWFYCDCIAQEHNVKVWSPAFWKLLEKYFLTFSSHGINLLLTPVFTPPLDTKVGGERMTTQLIDVRKTGTKYEFGFAKFDRWVRLAQKCGIEFFEISHLFTQWGAKFTPKIVADVNGKEKRIFGWDVAADSRQYRAFLDAFLPLLKARIEKLGLRDRVYFHISDEPVKDVIENYKTASAILKKHLKGWRIMDAASHPEFYTDGLVQLPVPSESELDKFMELDISERWTYYCGGPALPYSNRIHAMPASANRIMGTLLYLYRCDGFLHWGFNFWNSGLSTRPMPPLANQPDWDYISGDQCLVYPGPEGPLDAMRSEVFFAGLQDMRALQKLESLIGREKTVALIRKTAGMELRMNAFPLDEAFLPSLREKVNAAIEKASAK